MDKAGILDQIRHLASQADGVPPGQVHFEKVTGVSRSVWRGKYWRSWSEALEEAGFTRNQASAAYTDEFLVQSLASLTRKLGRFPTEPDIRLEKRDNSSFPNRGAFSPLGPHTARIRLVRSFASQHADYADVLAKLPLGGLEAADESSDAQSGRDGSVYMLKLGTHYKIGHTFSVPRRHREISLELPQKPDVVHVISQTTPRGSRRTGTADSHRRGRTASGSLWIARMFACSNAGSSCDVFTGTW